MNLLPWREREKIYQKKMVNKLFLSSVTATICCFVMLHWMLEKHHDRLMSQVQHVQHELNTYLMHSSDDEKMTALSTRFESLIHHQKTMKNLLLALGESMNTPVCFTDIARYENRISFSGKARSLEDLTAYLLSWKAAYLFSEIKINQLKQDNQFVQFRFQAEENAA